MKCDFNYNHVHSGIKPVKPDDSRRQGSYTTACLEGSYKDCIKDYERLSDVGSPVVSPRIVELETESKPLHNKENQHIQQTLDSSNDIQELETSGFYEDSGYSSFPNKVASVNMKTVALPWWKVSMTVHNPACYGRKAPTSIPTKTCCQLFILKKWFVQR